MLLTRVINAYIISVDINKIVGYIIILILFNALAHRMNIMIFKINRSKNEISTHSFESSWKLDMDEAKQINITRNTSSNIASHLACGLSPHKQFCIVDTLNQ